MKTNTKISTLTKLFSILSILLLSNSCGGGTSGTGGDAAFTKNTFIVNLTAQDKKELCVQIDRSVNEVTLEPNVFCPLVGATSAVNPSYTVPGTVEEKCADLDSFCRDNFSVVVDYENQNPITCNLNSDTVIANCTATVGEVYECFQDFTDTLIDLSKEAQCIGITEDAAQQVATKYNDILKNNLRSSYLSSCKLLIEHCPNFGKQS
jgi:hypothetical protein